MTDSRNDIGAPFPQRKQQDHDPLCPVGPPRPPDVACLWCEVIAKVRADERAKVEAEHDAWRDTYRADLRAEVEVLTLYAPSPEMRGWDLAKHAVIDLIDGGSDE